MHDETGVLVAPGDGPTTAAALLGLVDDPAGRRRLGCRGQQRAEEVFAEGSRVRPPEPRQGR